MTSIDAPAQTASGTKGAPIEVRPDGVVPVRRSGPAPHSVLLFGGGVLTGWGLLDHERGLPGQVAPRLQSKTGRGVDLDVIVATDPTQPAALELLRGLRISRYDAIVIVLGERPALDGDSRGEWSLEFEALVKTLNAEASKASPILIFDSARAMVAVSSSGLRRRRALGRAEKLAATARAVCEGGRVAFGELSAPSTVLGWGRQFASANHRTWADEIVASLRPALDVADRETGPDTAASVRDREQDERYRQRAVDALRLSADQRDALLDGIVLQAKSVLKASYASLHIVDDDRTWAKASSSSMLMNLPRKATFCDVAVRSHRALIIGDTSTDPRFGGETPEVGGMPVVFYAGEPIHSVDGYRIGTLCITDSKARSLRPDQVAELHALAGRIEREIWARTLGARR